MDRWRTSMIGIPSSKRTETHFFGILLTVRLLGGGSLNRGVVRLFLHKVICRGFIDHGAGISHPPVRGRARSINSDTPSGSLAMTHTNA